MRSPKELLESGLAVIDLASRTQTAYARRVDEAAAAGVVFKKCGTAQQEN